MRVCTTVAIGVVAETCSPFTVLPALMNEYRVREMNVQNGVLKSLAFMYASFALAFLSNYYVTLAVIVCFVGLNILVKWARIMCMLLFPFSKMR